MNVQFSSRINFLSKREFSRLPLQPSEFVDEYDGRNIKTSDRAYTWNIVMCNGGGVTNGRQTVFYHFQPWGSTKENIQKLVDELRKLHQQNPSLRALLIGGHDSDPRSIEIKDRLSELFSNAKIPFSMLWGHRHYPQANAHSWRSNVAYDTHHDTWLIRTHWQDKDVSSEKDLKRAFQQIELDPGDELMINSKPCKAKGLYKKKRRWWD